MESALEALGFKPVRAGGGDEPAYRLYAPDNPEKPVAVCLAYSWNRYLDGRDETRDLQTPDENPGARVVHRPSVGEAPWAIVTNGKLWRLYSARSHSRSTNYYEIDLDETLAMADPNEAFRYFWLFFPPERLRHQRSPERWSDQGIELPGSGCWTRARATPRVSESA